MKLGVEGGNWSSSGSSGVHSGDNGLRQVVRGVQGEIGV